MFEIEKLKKAMPEATFELFTEGFSDIDYMNKWTLVGGTALSIHLLHRLSEDLDFFIEKSTLDQEKANIERMISNMDMISWEATPTGNIKVLNDTSDLYRFFNCTQSCEFIYAAVEKTIKETLPNELKYLDAFDKAYGAINEIIEMPDNAIKSLITFILQNNGKLSKKKKEKYYEKLKLDEIKEIEGIVEEFFWSVS